MLGGGADWVTWAHPRHAPHTVAPPTLVFLPCPSANFRTMAVSLSVSQSVCLPPGPLSDSSANSQSCHQVRVQRSMLTWVLCWAPHDSGQGRSGHEVTDPPERGTPSYIPSLPSALTPPSWSPPPPPTHTPSQCHTTHTNTKCILVEPHRLQR